MKNIHMEIFPSELQSYTRSKSFYIKELRPGFGIVTMTPSLEEIEQAHAMNEAFDLNKLLNKPTDDDKKEMRL